MTQDDLRRLAMRGLITADQVPRLDDAALREVAHRAYGRYVAMASLTSCHANNDRRETELWLQIWRWAVDEAARRGLGDPTYGVAA